LSELVQHQAWVCAFVAVLLLIALTNLSALRRLGTDPLPARWPRVSVLVPARNEEENIGPCLRSLLGQDYPDFHVLALDDNSSDRTWQILIDLAKEDQRLLVRQGLPLPAGWLGKHWACHQLARIAGGEYLLFTDADTRHRPQSLRAAMTAILASRSDLLSALVKEETVTWGEKLTVPIMSWAVFSFLPLALASRLHIPALTAAQGQYMLFRRQAYEQIGGHAAVRRHAADDLALVRAATERGLSWQFCDASRLVSCRMYGGFREAFDGFSKNLFAAFDYNPLVYVPIWIWLGIVFLEPPVMLALIILGVPLPGASGLLAAGAVGLSLMLWCVSSWRTGMPWYLPLFYPLIMVVAEAVAARSLLLTISGGATWKGRRLERTG
jgi:chlorobactene glucosyltransferase